MENKPEKSDEMRGMSKPDYEIHQEARRQFSEIMGMCCEEREQCRDDRRFYAVSGAQWEGDYAEQFENKARIEINKTHLSIIRIQSAHRKNPITSKFISRDGTDGDALAETCAGLYRSDEQDSTATEARNNAFEEAISGGFGAYRLRTTWEDEEDEDDDRQRIEFEPIFDADQRVFFDPNAKRQDKSDAMYAFVLNPHSRESYDAMYDDSPADWPRELFRTTNFDWVTDNSVYVAEYYRVEEEDVTFEWFTDISDVETKYESAKITPKMRAEFAAVRSEKTKTKTVKRRKVTKYIMSGAKILNPGGEQIAGTNIPVIPCYGKRIVVDNIERCIGHVRLAKDAQRLKNMQVSRLAEIASKSTVEKPIFFAEQVAGHEDIWADDVIEDYPYLTINAMYDEDGKLLPAGAIGYTKAPSIPPGLAALLQMTDADLKEILGNPEGVEEVRSNVSGDAIEQIVAQLDMQSFIYMANMAMSVQHDGKVWLGMARDVYTEDGRAMKSVTKGGDTTSIIINAPTVGKDNEIKSDTDISKAKFNVYTSVAPASASRKAATVRNLTSMMKAGGGDEESVLVMKLFALMNTEGEGMTEMRDYAAMRLVRMGVLEPSDEQAEKLKEEEQAKKNQPKDPNTAYLESEARKNEAQAAEAEARRMKAVADAAKVEADTIGILAEMHPQARNEVLQIFTQMQEARAAGQPAPELPPLQQPTIQQ